jgi:hypothetical protein
MIESTFDITSIDTLFTTACYLKDEEQAPITGKQLKAITEALLELRDNVAQCHALLNDMGVPAISGDIEGLLNRLKQFEEVWKSKYRFKDESILETLKRVSGTL